MNSSLSRFNSKWVTRNFGTIIIFHISFCLISCNSLRGHFGVSDDIAESKKRGVFICEYKSLEYPANINDSLKLEVKYAWLEHRWYYPEDLNESIEADGFHFIVVVNPENLKGYDSSWAIGVDSIKYFRWCAKNCIITDFENLPADTLSWDVQEGNNFNSVNKHIILGIFKMVKTQKNDISD